MMGENNSVASRLRVSCPGIFIMKCVCHSAHLCVSEACKYLPRSCEDLARNIYNFLKTSSKRKSELKQFQRFMDIEPQNAAPIPDKMVISRCCGLETPGTMGRVETVFYWHILITAFNSNRAHISKFKWTFHEAILLLYW